MKNKDQIKCIFKKKGQTGIIEKLINNWLIIDKLLINY